MKDSSLILEDTLSSRDDFLTYYAIMIANRCDTFICHALYGGSDCCSFFLQLTDGSSMQGLLFKLALLHLQLHILHSFFNMYKHLGTHWQNKLADTVNYVHRCDSQHGRREMVLLWGVFIYRLMTGLRLFLNKLLKNCLHHLCGTWLLYGNVLSIPSRQSKISLGVWIKPAWGGSYQQVHKALPLERHGRHPVGGGWWTQ